MNKPEGQTNCGSSQGCATNDTPAPEGGTHCYRAVPHWWLTKDGDAKCLELYERHYSAYQYADGRERKLFCGPGFKLVLRTDTGNAFFVWRKFIDACIDERTGQRQSGINCAAFRNEGTVLSSRLIREADAIADFIWPGERHYTYINEKRVKSKLPGECFRRALWRYVRVGKRRLRTKSGLLIMEKEASKTPEFVDLAEAEKLRVYRFEDGTKVELKDVRRIAVSDSGTHRVETGDGRKHIIPTGWNHIELDVPTWTF